MSDQPKSEEKKIIVDQDWKSQVEAEKEAARQADVSTESPPPETDEGPLPPPSLTVLASSLYLQGIIMLGLLPGPESDQPEVHLEQAKHAIDMLQMLYEKTEGNRTSEETAEMDRMLHELRMAFLAVQQQGQMPQE